MEKKKILDQSGITVKGLFIVFKRIWFVLLAIVIICGAGYTFLDSYKKKQLKPYLYSEATLYLNKTSQQELSKKYEYIKKCLAENKVKADVERSEIFTDAKANNVSSEFVFYYVGGIKYVGNETNTKHPVETKVQYKEDGTTETLYEFKKENVLTYINKGDYWLSTNGTEAFTITYRSNYATKDQVRTTLQQICYSLMNRLKAEWMPDFESASSSIVIEMDKPASSAKEDRTNLKEDPKAPFIGIVIGILLSAALVLVIYKLDDTIKSKEELERLTNVMFITYIEDIGDSKGGSKK